MNKAAQCGLCFFQVVGVKPALDAGEHIVQQRDQIATLQPLHVALYLARD